MNNPITNEDVIGAIKHLLTDNNPNFTDDYELGVYELASELLGVSTDTIIELTSEEVTT